jgi:hypothetical protein
VFPLEIDSWIIVVGGVRQDEKKKNTGGMKELGVTLLKMQGGLTLNKRKGARWRQ